MSGKTLRPCTNLYHISCTVQSNGHVENLSTDRAITTIIKQVAAGHQILEEEFKRHCTCSDCGKWRIHND